MDAEQVVAILCLVMVAALDLVASIAVVKTRNYRMRHKLVQLVVIWLVPIIGAIVCLLMTGLDKGKWGPDKPREFFDNQMF